MEESIAKDCGVVCEGETISIGSLGKNGRALRWKVAMSEPVLQGVVQTGFTRFLVLPLAVKESAYEDDSGNEEGTGDDELGSDDHVDDSTPVKEGSMEDFDIDESFLAASVLEPLRQPRSSAPSTPSSAPSIVNLHSAVVPPSAAPAKSLVVSAHPITHPVSSPLLIPRPSDDEDEMSRIYLKTRDLSKLGMFSGDWVVVEGEENEGDKRLARCFASDGVLSVSLSSHEYVFLFVSLNRC